MTLTENAEIAHHRAELLDSMTGYMIDCATNSEFGACYTQADIDQCDRILDAFLTALDSESRPAAPEKIGAIVKLAVLALNDLNDECEGNLIETDQREHLCDIFTRAANKTGLDSDEDITQAWRAW